MARVTLDRLEYYSNQFSAVADEAENYFRIRVEEVFRGVDLASLSKDERKELRNRVIDIVRETEDLYCDASSSMGSMFYEEVLESDGIYSRAVLTDAPNDAQVENSVRYWAKGLFDDEPDVGKFINGVASFIVRTVGHAGDLTILQSAENDERRGIRYARVPQGPSCGFCIMLASRGFVYRSKEYAGGDGYHGTDLDRFHDFCDCRIVAGYEGLEVEGYHPEELYERYKQCRETITHGKDYSDDPGDNPIWKDWDRLTDKQKAKYTDRRGNQSYNSYLEHRIVEEMNSRDRQWLYGGTPCRVEYAPEWNQFEIDTADILGGLGFVVRPIPRTTKHRTPDFHLNDAEWEMKCPEDYNEWTVWNQFKSNVKKGGVVNLQSERLVISNCGNGASFDEICADIQKIIDDGKWLEVSQIMAVGRNKELRRWKR